MVYIKAIAEKVMFTIGMVLHPDHRLMCASCLVCSLHSEVFEVRSGARFSCKRLQTGHAGVQACAKRPTWQ